MVISCSEITQLPPGIFFFFFLIDRPPPDISPLPLPAALPISARRRALDRVPQHLAAGGCGVLPSPARGRALSGREHYEFAAPLPACPPARLFVNDRLD